MRAHAAAQAIEIRRGEIERLQEGGSQYFKVFGEIQINGIGEAAIAVGFPVYFVDKPLYSFGPSLGPGQPYYAGNMPFCLPTVLRFDELIRDDGTVVYTGMLIGTICDGGPVPVVDPLVIDPAPVQSGQVMILQWHAEGIGLRDPTPES